MNIFVNYIIGCLYGIVARYVFLFYVTILWSQAPVDIKGNFENLSWVIFAAVLIYTIHIGAARKVNPSHKSPRVSAIIVIDFLVGALLGFLARVVSAFILISLFPKSAPDTLNAFSIIAVFIAIAVLVYTMYWLHKRRERSRKI